MHKTGAFSQAYKAVYNSSPFRTFHACFEDTPDSFTDEQSSGQYLSIAPAKRSWPGIRHYPSGLHRMNRFITFA